MTRDSMRVNSFIKNKEGLIIPVSDNASLVQDENYIDGVIELSIGGIELLSKKHCDLVDQLWCYMLTGLEQISQGNSYTTYFPDQPIKLEFELKNYDLVQVLVDDGQVNTATIRITEFINFMNDGCQFFFTHLPKWAPSLTRLSKDSIERLKNLN